MEHTEREDPKNTTMPIRCTSVFKEAVSAHAKRKGLGVSGLVRTLLITDMKKRIK